MAALKDAGVTPGERTTDFEFIRRLTLDLTGRIRTPDRVVSFVNDTSADKRARRIEELMAKPEWVDKWTMFFGDLFKNASNTTQINRYPQGRDAFNKWIHDSLAANKPYDKMATELIAATGSDTFSQGELNWIVGGRMTGGPAQDTYDQMAANVAETFLGLSNVNCLLCHNGRGHVDQRPVTTRNTARNVILVLMAGAPSHIDTFDFKVVPGVTPSNFNPATIKDIVWPTGLMPKLADQLPNLAIVRSVKAWATGHSIWQHWVQIGRNPSGALGDVAPNIGSVVAIEKYGERQSNRVLPTFIALNSGGAVGAGTFQRPTIR